MNKYFKCESIRLQRYLYSLGFEKISKYENKKEYWLFEYSALLQQSLDFYFSMRKKNKGVIDNENLKKVGSSSG